MSSGKQLQEMEVGTKQSKTAVNAKASPAEPMQKLKDPGPGLTGKVEDLGGPTPDNASPTNDSMKLKDPAGSLLQSVSAVNKGASKAEKMGTLKQGDEAEVTDEQEVVSEEPATEEVVAEVSEEAPELDIDEDVNALLGGEELSEEFKAKAKTIFEAAVKSRVNEARAEIEAAHAEKLAEDLSEAKQELTERVDN